MITMKTRVHLEQAPKALDHEASANYQHKRQGRFDNDKSGARTMSVSASREASPTFLQRFVDVASQTLKCRNHAEDDSREQRDDYCESERGATHVNLRQHDLVGRIR